jgi:hypothetical protein
MNAVITADRSDHSVECGPEFFMMMSYAGIRGTREAQF